MSKSSYAERVARALRWAPGIVLALALCGHTANWWTLTPVRQLDAYWHDARLRAFASDVADPRIAVVDIDEQSIKAIGRWPWSRSKLAELIETLFERERAALVGVDLILSEPENSAGLALVDSWANGPLASNAQYRAHWNKHRSELDGDSRLVSVLRRHPVVTGVHGIGGNDASRNGHLPSALVEPTSSRPITMAAFSGYSGNFPALAESSAGAGLLDAWIDHDGLRRRMPLLAQLDGRTYGSLSLVMALVSQGCTSQKPPRLVVQEDGFGQIQGCQTEPAATLPAINLGPLASVLMPYARPPGLAAVYSAADVLQGRIPDGSLSGKLVLLGTTAPGLGDLHATPVSEAFPGVQGHATLLSAILDGKVPRESPAAPAVSTAAVLTVALGLGALMWRLQPLGAGIASLVVVVSCLVGSAYAWAAHHEAIPVAAALLLTLMIFAWRVLYSQVLERRQRRRIENLFGQYVPPELVAKMSRDPEHHDMQGRSAELTILFADLHGFTRIAESMSASDLATLMNTFFSEMTDVVRAHGGTLDKYIGDSVMAFWGAPLADKEHALHAVQAAQAMCERLPALNAAFAARGWPSLSLAIGVNSGAVVVGDMGSRHRRAYTVLGDAVNVAARLQSLCSELGQTILIGQATCQLLPQDCCKAVGTQQLRGRNGAVEVFTPADRSTAPGRIGTQGC